MKPWRGAILALTLAGCGAQGQEPPNRHAVRITATPVPLDRDDLAMTALGPFAYAGGIQLTSPDTARLGGLSDLKIDADGRVTSVSDEGELLRAHLLLDANRRVSGLDQAVLQPLTGPDTQPLQGKREGDAEGVALWPNGDLMISFERDHRIWIYPAAGGPPRAAPMPQTIMGDNQGMEALTLAPSRGADAYWVGIETGSIWLCRLSSGCVQDRVQVRPPFGFRLTALSETAAGDLVLLHHAYNPLLNTSRVLVRITRLGPDGRPQDRARLDLKPPLTVDNFEGVETALLPGGAMRLFLLSDDNFSDNQRTLLLAFDWTPPAPRRPQPPPVRR